MIEVKNVSKKYGKFYAVRDINFSIKDGEIVGFLGRNGAGKTTTMNMITGFIEPTEGTIIVNGYDVDKKPKKVKESIGYMPEGTPLYSDLTVKEFVRYMAELKLVPRKERKTAVEKAINETGLEKVQNKLTKNLSRGYKQRVSLAGAIVGDPKILILDEPTVGLDPAQVIEIRELIKSFRKNHTVILSSHILSEISQICEKVIIIDKGEIVAVDTPEHLEKDTSETTVLKVTVEDQNDSFATMKDEIETIKEIKFLNTNEDGSKNYQVETTSKDNDVRKELFSKCAKKDIVILEMKQDTASLEDAFIKLVEDRPEYSEKEIEKQQYQKELDNLREELEGKKQAKKEEKARKKAKKEEAKASKEEKKEKKAEAKTSETEVKEVKKENKTSKTKKKENKKEADNEKEEGGDK